MAPSPVPAPVPAGFIRHPQSGCIIPVSDEAAHQGALDAQAAHDSLLPQSPLELKAQVSNELKGLQDLRASMELELEKLKTARASVELAAAQAIPFGAK